MTFLKIFFSLIIVLPLYSPWSWAATTYEKIIISGETASNGIYDPSIEYITDGSTGYMAYTACDNWPMYIHTHLAKTTDHGQTWTFVQQINPSVFETINILGVPTNGYWHNETSTLIHDPDDPGREWKLYWNHHFFKEPYNPSQDKVWAYGWVGYKYTSNPEGSWSDEINLFGAGPYPLAPYSAQIDLNALNPLLTNYIVHIEPGGLYLDNTLYLAFQANTANREDQILHLIKSTDHGNNWSFVDILANSQTAAAMGYDFSSAPGLVHDQGRTFLFYAPGFEGPGLPTHDGTQIVEFDDINTGQLSISVAPALTIFKYLSPSIDTFNAGESDYDYYNFNGGIILPQFQPTPPVEFQIWNTHQFIIPTSTVSPTPTTQSEITPLSTEVTTYPNPAADHIDFLIQGTTGAMVIIDIYNLLGEQIATMQKQLGQNNLVTWNCQTVSPGLYIALISVDGKQIRKTKLVIAR